MALTQAIVVVSEHDLAADLAGAAAALEGMARAEDMGAHCELRLEEGAAGSAVGAVGLDVVLAKQRWAERRQPLVVGPSSSWVKSWARQLQPVLAARLAAVHLALLLHSGQRFVAADSAQCAVISLSHLGCARTTSSHLLVPAAVRPTLRARYP